MLLSGWDHFELILGEPVLGGAPVSGAVFHEELLRILAFMKAEGHDGSGFAGNLDLHVHAEDGFCKFQARHRHTNDVVAAGCVTSPAAMRSSIC